ncbi:unnamed protein product [Closterium sp. Naga37s-1]|nr:unnamed protein product [Closterium sp. Naga37s-1]
MSRAVARHSRLLAIALAPAARGGGAAAPSIAAVDAPRPITTTATAPASATAPSAAAAAAAPALGGAAGAFVDVPTTQIRRIIAQRLMESKWGSPHLYAEAEADIDATLQLRKELKDKWGVAVSVNDFVIKAVAMALAHTPDANVHWDGKAGRVVSNSSVDISIAVATDKGLITPILKDADKKSLGAISKEVTTSALLFPPCRNPFHRCHSLPLAPSHLIATSLLPYIIVPCSIAPCHSLYPPPCLMLPMPCTTPVSPHPCALCVMRHMPCTTPRSPGQVKQLVERARAGKLQPHEFQGGTFSISNLGMYAVDRFSAILNPPQSGILAVGRSDKLLLFAPFNCVLPSSPFCASLSPSLPPSPSRPTAGAQLQVASKMEVTLSADARALDGTTAGKLLSAISANLSDPRRLLI